MEVNKIDEIRDDEIFEDEEDFLEDNGKDIELIYDDEEHVDEEGKRYYFCLRHPDDKIWWTAIPECRGPFYFSFDKKHLYELGADYPFCMTDEEVEIFDKENPDWAEYFKWRKNPEKLSSKDKKIVSEAPWFLAWKKKYNK